MGRPEIESPQFPPELIVEIIKTVVFLGTLTVSASTLFAFDWILCFEKEITQLWSKRWRKITYLYALNRFAPFALSVFLLFDTFVPQKPSILINYCWWDNYLGESLYVFVPAVVQTILSLRTYALWRKKWMVAMLLIFTWGIFLSQIIVIAVHDGKIYDIAINGEELFPEPYNYTCTVQFASTSWERFIAPIVLELVQVSLIVIKLVQYAKFGMNTEVRRVLVRDGLPHYLASGILTNLDAAFRIAAGQTDSIRISRAVSVVARFLPILSSILAARMVLGIRDILERPRAASEAWSNGLSSLGARNDWEMSQITKVPRRVHDRPMFEGEASREQEYADVGDSEVLDDRDRQTLSSNF